MSMSGKQMMALEALLLEELIAERDSLRKRVKDLEKQPEQKPVAWYVDFGNDDEPNYVCIGQKPTEPTANVRPLVFGDTTPPQRTWVGLTDEERLEAAEIDGADEWFWKVCKAIEAKLKEKNLETRTGAT